MLWHEDSPDVFTPWFGTPIDGVVHSQNIESVWSAEELAEWHLYVPAPAEDVPEGKRVASISVQRVDDVVRFVNELEDLPSAPLRLIEIAAAKLEAIDGELVGIEKGHGIVGGFADGDVAYVYFDAEQPDLDYSVTPSEGVVKFTDHVEVTRPGLTVFSFLIQRVQ